MNIDKAGSLGALTRTAFACSLAWAGAANALPAITDRLIASYEFSGDATDTSGNGNTLFVGGATLAADRFGNPDSAYSFDGVNDYMRTSTAFFDLGAPAYTINYWLKIDDLYSRYPANIVVNTDPHTGIAIGANHIANPGPRFSYFVGDGLPGSWAISQGSVAGFKNDLTEGIWYQSTIVKDGGSWQFFVNGLLDATVYGSLQSSLPATLYFGAAGFLDTWLPEFLPDHFGGSLDDISIYSRALTGSEITTLYQAEPTAVPAPATLPLMLACAPALAFVARRKKSSAD